MITLPKDPGSILSAQMMVHNYLLTMQHRVAIPTNMLANTHAHKVTTTKKLKNMYLGTRDGSVVKNVCSSSEDLSLVSSTHGQMAHNYP